MSNINIDICDGSPRVSPPKSYCWNRWVSLTAGVYLMLCAGPVLSYGAISENVANLLGANDQQQQLIGTCGNLGLWTNVVGGLVFDHFGPRPTLLAASLLASVGYLMMYLALIQQWHPLAAAAAWFAAGHGSGWIYISTLFSNVKNYEPKDRCFVVGSMSCFFGLGPAVMTAILGGCLGGQMDGQTCNRGFLGGSVTGYLLFLSITVAFVGIVGASLTKVEDITDQSPADHAQVRFKLLSACCLVIVIFICGTNLISLMVSPSIKTWVNYILFALLLSLLTLPFGVPSPNETTSTEAIMPGAPPKALEGLMPREVVKKGTFWCLWFVFGICVASYIMTVNNMVSLAINRGATAEPGRVCVILATGFDTFSRFTSGFAMGHDISPTKLFALGPVLFLLAQLILALTSDVVFLYIMCVPLGLGHGLMWTIGPFLSGKAFGLKAAGKNFGMIVLGAATFALTLMLGVVAAVKQAHIQPGEQVCVGPDCYRLSHIVTASLDGLALGLAICLHHLLKG